MFKSIRFWIAISVIALALSGCLGFSLANKINEVNDVREALQKERNDNQALVEAIAALAASNEAEQERLDQMNQNLADIAREPVTEGCGPSVHGAIERLRQ